MSAADGISPGDFIELVRDRVSLIDFLSAYTTLTQTGSEWRGRCPLHDEKTGSFYANDAKGVWICYGCGKGGNIFTFLQEKEGLGFREAADLLADRYRLPRLGTGRSEQHDRMRRLRQMHEAAAAWFGQVLREQRGRPFQEYLRQRDFSKEDVVRFGLGAAPDEWEGLSRVLLGKGFRQEELLQAGLALARKEGTGVYDRFRGRLMIPIRARDGSVIAFGGRIIGPGEPKYLNSPETDLFKKNRTLFALDLAKDAMKRTGRVCLMEGYTDVMRAHQRGLHYAVAAMGTALTTEQISELQRFATEVLLMMDSDAAGRQAAVKHARNLIRQEMPVRILLLKEGQDPDDFFRQAEHPLEDFEALVQQSLHAIEFMLRDLADAHLQTADPQRRAALRQEAIAITRLPRQVSAQAEALDRLAQLLGVSRASLAEDAKRAPSPEPAPATADRPVVSLPMEPLAPADQELLAAMLLSPALESLGLAYLTPRDFNHVLAQRLIGELHEARQLGNREPLQYLPKLEFDPDLGALVASLLILMPQAPELPVFKRMLTRYRAVQLQQERAALKRSLQDASQTGNHDHARQLLQREQELGRVLNLLERHIWPEDAQEQSSASA
ncbi:MAG: DNA primase [bacterium]|nr:DNA primase [bacterium]